MYNNIKKFYFHTNDNSIDIEGAAEDNSFDIERSEITNKDIEGAAEDNSIDKTPINGAFIL